MATQTYAVQGMTCSHCAAAVTAEVQGLDGVTAVRVDVPRGTVTVESTDPVADEAVAAAVDEAGYEVVGGGGRA